jgi:acyl CoA:acetate/3-ketoacid CoA transferase beta subunit
VQRLLIPPLIPSHLPSDITVMLQSDVTGQGLLLRELAPGISLEAVRDRTHAPISAAEAIDIIAT